MFSLFSAKFIFSFSKYSNVRLTFVDLRWAKLYVCLVCNNPCFLSSWLSKEDKDLDLLSRCSSLGRVSQGICLWLWGSSPCVARGFQSTIVFVYEVFTNFAKGMTSRLASIIWSGTTICKKCKKFVLKNNFKKIFYLELIVVKNFSRLAICKNVIRSSKLTNLWENV